MEKINHTIEPENAQNQKTVLFAILARNQEKNLPEYLKCLREQTFPLKNIHLYIRTNDNADRTERILERFIKKHSPKFASVFYDNKPVDPQDSCKQGDNHEWTPKRFKRLAAIREASLQKAVDLNCDYYFVADCDNFIVPICLQSLVHKATTLGLKIVAPMLKCKDKGHEMYSNFHADIDLNGYFRDCPLYADLLYNRVPFPDGICCVPVVHCTYLIDTQVIKEKKVWYLDGTDRYEYVIFSDSARKSRVLQHLDNSQYWGYLTFSC